MYRTILGLALAAASITSVAHAQEHPAPLPPAGACPAACPPAACSQGRKGLDLTLKGLPHEGHVLGRIANWFCYKSLRGCKPELLNGPCNVPLYLYFLRDCAYCSGGPGQGPVNPSYSHSVFPPGAHHGCRTPSCPSCKAAPVVVPH
jgi:hypothetical protein